MTSAALGVVKSSESTIASIQGYINGAIDDLLASLGNPGQLSAEERRGIIARYTAVLEGNFIYWMTGAYISVRSDEARAKIMDNLREEIRDCHPGMMRRFAIAADAIPTDADAQAVHRNLMNVRLFIGRLSPVPIVVTMAFFEGFIQRFMPYLAELAQRQGSAEMEYTDVHGVCDVTHTQELFRALEAEMVLAHPLPETQMFEGVELLRTLIQSMVVNERSTNARRGSHVSQGHRDFGDSADCTA
jgi:DNA-binding Lrp family transcriptional regulator